MSNNLTTKESMLENKIELLEEDIYCIHKYLDTLKIPREKDGNKYSIIGRIKILQEELDRNFL